jgi:hypothetical protein
MPSFQCAYQIRSIFESIKVPSKVQKTSQLNHPSIDKSKAWGYFDGASQGQQALRGTRGTLFLNDTHHNFKARLGVHPTTMKN